MICRIELVSICMLMALTSMAFADDTSKGIVVWQLGANQGVEESDVSLISNYVTNQVAKYSNRKVISEADIRTILKGEETRQKCGSEDASCVAEIGAALGVPEAVSGDIGRLGRVWMLNLRRINVRNASVIKRSSRQVDGEVDDLVLAIPSAVAELFGVNVVDQAGIVSISSQPDEAIISLDGRELGRTPLKRSMAEGNYKLAVTKEGYFEEHRIFSVKPGERTDVSVTMRAIPMNPYNLWGHVTFWSGLGLVGIGGILNWQAIEREDSYNKSGSSSDKSANHAFMGTAVAGYTLGGALLVTGAVLWILDPGDDAWAKQNMVSVGVGPEGRGVGLVVAGRW